MEHVLGTGRGEGQRTGVPADPSSILQVQSGSSRDHTCTRLRLNMAQSKYSPSLDHYTSVGEYAGRYRSWHESLYSRMTPTMLSADVLHDCAGLRTAVN